MAVSFQLPDELESNLRHDFQDLDAEAREAFLVDLYRRRRISHHALAGALGLDRFETEGVLRKHQVTEDLGTVDDYLRDAQTLEQLRSQGRR